MHEKCANQYHIKELFHLYGTSYKPKNPGTKKYDIKYISFKIQALNNSYLVGNILRFLCFLFLRLWLVVIITYYFVISAFHNITLCINCFYCIMCITILTFYTIIITQSILHVFIYYHNILYYIFIYTYIMW